MEYNYNGNLAIINFFLWFILIFVYRTEYYRATNRKGKYDLIGIITILFCTFAFSTADTYHYEVLYNNMTLYNTCLHVEDFYFWLLSILPNNFYIWRLAIWGTATLIYIKVCKINNLDNRIVGLIFPLILLQQFAVTRGCLGITLFLLGASILIKRKQPNKTSYLLSVCAIVASLFLHKSLPLFIAIATLALVPLNKKTFIILIILFPIFRGFVIPFVFDFLGSGLFSEDTTSFATKFLEQEKSERNILGTIRLIIDYIPKFLIFIALIKFFIFKKAQIPKNIRFFFNYSFLLFYIALLFLGQETSSFITNRTIHIMSFTLLIPFAYYLMYNNHSFTTRIAILFLALSNLLEFMYFIYKY